MNWHARYRENREQGCNVARSLQVVFTKALDEGDIDTAKELSLLIIAASMDNLIIGTYQAD